MAVIIGLIIGWFVILIINLKRGYSVKEELVFSWEGIKSAGNVIVTLCLVGVLTGLWRGSGTIPYIVSAAINYIDTRFLIIEIFLLCCLVSFLIGTSIGTAATVGIVSMIIANSAGISPVLAGGAIMSGIYFGDRCSYISSSALLVAEVTGTKIYDNVKEMLKTAALPFAITCIVYVIPNIISPQTLQTETILPEFGNEFVLSWVVIIPAVLVLVLSILHINIKISLVVSSLSAIVICLLVQNSSAEDILRYMISGYKSADTTLAPLIDGGGLQSMLRVLVTIFLSTTYAGIVKNTKLLELISEPIYNLAKRFGRTGALIIVSIVTVVVGCNQTLGIILTSQLAGCLYDDKKEFAIALENTVEVIAPLIPWCIAAAVPINMLNLPVSCLIASCYLYLLPVWELIRKK